VAWSIKLFSLGGTAVRVHLTFFLLVAWIGAMEWQRGTAADAINGVSFILVLFACVVLHEFGHIWAARRYGIRTPDVTLLPIGGVASMERMPEKPSQEIAVALAGPAVNLVIAVVLFTLLGVSFDLGHMTVESVGASFWVQVAIANMVLLAFNLIPAFPMDGGRVLRALLASWLGFARGTAVAARIGQVLAVGLAVLGFMEANPFLVLIAAFIFMAAAGEAGYVRMHELARGRTAGEAMVTPFQSVGAMASVADAAAVFAHSTQGELPVVDGLGHLRGFIARKAVADAVSAGGGEAPALSLIAGEAPAVAVPIGAPLEAVLASIRNAPGGAVGVLDGAGRLAGYIVPASLKQLAALARGQSG
jgi:Zn-dependent protease/CBS domain-containing protein